jgi:uncharacterized protein
MLFYKSQDNTIEDVDIKSGIVSGYFSVFNIKDSDEDIIKKGAYKKSIKERGKLGSNRIKHLWQHDRDHPIATPELSEDTKGLRFKSKISQTTIGKDTITLYNDGVLTEHSVGFIPLKEQYSSVDKANIITEVELWEGSTVLWGAQELARIDGKSKKYIKSKIQTVSKALRSGTYTDETFKTLEKLLLILEDLGTHFESEPDKPTQKKNEPHKKYKDLADLFTNSYTI